MERKPKIKGIFKKKRISDSEEPMDGRVGRLLMFKERLANSHVPFIQVSHLLNFFVVMEFFQSLRFMKASRARAMELSLRD